MKCFVFLFVLFFALDANAFTRGAVKSVKGGWQIEYAFQAPDKTLGYTNIFIPGSTPSGTIVTQCDVSAPCDNAEYDGDNTLLDAGTQTVVTFIDNQKDASAYADKIATIKELNWIQAIGQ